MPCNIRGVKRYRLFEARVNLRVPKYGGRRSFTTNSSAFQQQVIVVRHGETDWNKTLRVQGSTDIPLNAKGRAQAAASAQALQDIACSRIYTSPLSRAQDTALAIAKDSTTVTAVDALREWDLGAVEGLRNAAEEYPDDWKIFQHWANPHVPMELAQTPLTNGESMEEVRWRAVHFIESVAREHHDQQSHRRIVCVSHGGVLGQLLRHVVQTTPSDTPRLEYHRPGNACISKFRLEFPNQASPQWSIDVWADTSHLTGDLAPVGVDYDMKE